MWGAMTTMEEKKSAETDGWQDGWETEELVPVVSENGCESSCNKRVEGRKEEGKEGSRRSGRKPMKLGAQRVT